MKSKYLKFLLSILILSSLFSMAQANANPVSYWKLPDGSEANWKPMLSMVDAPALKNCYYDANSLTFFRNQFVAFVVLRTLDTVEQQKNALNTVSIIEAKNPKYNKDYRKYAASLELYVWDYGYNFIGGALYHKVLDSNQKILNNSSFKLGIKNPAQINEANIRDVMQSGGMGTLKTESLDFIMLVSALEDPKNPDERTKVIHSSERINENEKRWVVLGNLNGNQYYYNPYSIRRYTKSIYAVLMRRELPYPAWYTILKSVFEYHILPYNIYSVILFDEANKRALTLAISHSGVDGQQTFRINNDLAYGLIKKGKFADLQWEPIVKGGVVSNILEDVTLRRKNPTQKKVLEAVKISF